MKHAIWMLSAALLLGLPPNGRAAETERETPETPETSRKHVAELATEYKVTQAQVQELRGKGMGWGEVRHALSLSERSGQPVSEIVKLRESGMGWGSIARKYDVKLVDAPANTRERELRGSRVRESREQRRGPPAGRGGKNR